MAPSISYHSHKGLLNGPGQNNCFLNSAVQVLWHLDIFRRSFRELSGHACMSESCIFCALKELFGQLQFSHERALPPDALRKALAQSFSDQHRFQLGFMDDAAECFENILLRIHYHIANHEAEDMCNARHCIPHQKFAMTLVEQSVCGVCNATSEPLPFTQMVHYVSASALISQAKHISTHGHQDLFGQLLKNAGGMGDIRDCPSSCGAKIQIRRTLMNRPEIVSVGIVWDSDRPSLEHIMSLLDTLRTHLRLSDIFHGCFDIPPGDNIYHELVGVVTYYGKHYSTFFFHTKLRVWVYFDDANVREVGPHWDQVVEKCRRGRYQPLLLLFAVPNGCPIDTTNAPKMITPASKLALNLYNGHHDIGSKLPMSMQRASLSPTANAILGGRRSLTPNPEKPRSSNDLVQRRAVTPNPEQSPPSGTKALPNNDYQNLLQYQEVVFNNCHNGVNQNNEEREEKQDMIGKYNHQPARKGIVRRDSGNWSGDRNSASSSSSTSLENPYHYIIGKMQMKTYSAVPRSPTSIKPGELSSGSGNSSGGHCDPGYDSYSLSSTDSLPLQHSLKHNLQLAQIPEGCQTPPRSNRLNASLSQLSTHSDDCERLCAEADQLLGRSEQAEDLATALSLCNAAANKARAAMDAPYSNPQTASFARMKHNACVMLARSLHRKLEDNTKHGEGRHSREGSNCSNRGSLGSHSRQNSKDKSGNHSRQNSQELLTISTSVANNNTNHVKQLIQESPMTNNEKLITTKNIEIYATLPKNKKGLLSRSSPKTKNVVEDEEYFMNERPGRSLFSNRSKTASKKEAEKRTRSEERNTKSIKDIIPASILNKDIGMKKGNKQDDKQNKQEEKQNKKQHKIRRKLLMGGLIRRKNRSMPDLREDTIIKDPVEEHSPKIEKSKDDTMIDSKVSIHGNLSGYLSEGNLENAGNPNLERSKLMRKSFYNIKSLQCNKVPPPPPLRTSSQLSKSDLKPLTPSYNHNTAPQTVYQNSNVWNKEPLSLPFMPADYILHNNKSKETDAVTYANSGVLLNQFNENHTNQQNDENLINHNMVITEAEIHHEASFQSLPPMVDGPNFITQEITKTDDFGFPLPPYPSPIHSTSHSRQASEEFPPPPPTSDGGEPQLSILSSQLQIQQEQSFSMNPENIESNNGHEIKPVGGQSWLRELQAKQAARKTKPNSDGLENVNCVDSNLNSVKDLKSRFEQVTIDDSENNTRKNCVVNEREGIFRSVRGSPIASSRNGYDEHNSDNNIGKKGHSLIRSNSKISAKLNFESKEFRRKPGKKKNVTFCEQVVLVATAEDDEVDNYIPNPILERVLRSVLHKEAKEVPKSEGKELTVQSVVPLKRTDSWKLSQNKLSKPTIAENVDCTHEVSNNSSDLNQQSHNSAMSHKSGKIYPSPLPNRALNLSACSNNVIDGRYPSSSNNNLSNHSSTNSNVSTSQYVTSDYSYRTSTGPSKNHQTHSNNDPEYVSNVSNPQSQHQVSSPYNPAFQHPHVQMNSNSYNGNNVSSSVYNSQNDQHSSLYNDYCRGVTELPNSVVTNGYQSSYNQSQQNFVAKQTYGTMVSNPQLNAHTLSRRLSNSSNCSNSSGSYANNAQNFSIDQSCSNNLIQSTDNVGFQLNGSSSNIHPQHDGYHTQHESTYPLQQDNTPYHQTYQSSKQPMSLQYHHSQSGNHTTIDNGHDAHDTKNGHRNPAILPHLTNGSQTSLSSHGSNNSNDHIPHMPSHVQQSPLPNRQVLQNYQYNKQLPPQDPRRMPVSSAALQNLSAISSYKILPSSRCNSLTKSTQSSANSMAYSSTPEMQPRNPHMTPVSNMSHNMHQYRNQPYETQHTSNQSLNANHHSGNERTRSPSVMNQDQMRNNISGMLPYQSVPNLNSAYQNSHSTIESTRSQSSSIISPYQPVPNLNSDYNSQSGNEPIRNQPLNSTQSPYQLVPNSNSGYQNSHSAESARNQSSSTSPYQSIPNPNSVYHISHSGNEPVRHHLPNSTISSYQSVPNPNSGFQNSHSPNEAVRNQISNSTSPYQPVPNYNQNGSPNYHTLQTKARIFTQSQVLHSQSQIEHNQAHNSTLHMQQNSAMQSNMCQMEHSQTNGSYKNAQLLPVYQPPPPPVNSKCNSAYQRAPTPNYTQQHMSSVDATSSSKYSPYQQPPLPKNTDNGKKFNATLHSSVSMVPCNLCRKKQITPPSVYCPDCNYYMSRYKQQRAAA